MRAKATTIEPSRITARRSESILITLSPFSTGASLMGKKSDNDRAIADSAEAIRVNPNYAMAFNNRGFAYAKKGDNNRAIADYNEAIRLDPRNALAFASRGIAYGKKGDNDRAI